MAYSVSFDRQRQSGINEIAKVSKHRQWDLDPGLLIVSTE